MTDDIVVMQGAGDELVEIMSPTDSPPVKAMGSSGDRATGGAPRCCGLQVVHAPLTMEKESRPPGALVDPERLLQLHL